MNYREKLFFIITCVIMFLASVFWACSSRPSVVISASAKATANDVLTRMPAQNSAEENEFSAALVDLGPAGMRYLCEKLVPPGKGNDTNARYALNGLTWYVHRPGAEVERKMYAGAIIEALDSEKNIEVKAFLIKQLQYAGNVEAVAPLGKYLTNERLCEPATQALLAIRTKGAEAALINALPVVNDKNLVTIIKALGDLQSKAAAYEILKYTVSEDKNTRFAALYALANIGPVSTDVVLAEAMQTTSAYERAKATSFQLLYAQRLAEAGQTNQAADICRNLIKTRTAPGEENIQVAALSTLVRAVSEAALWDLLEVVDSSHQEIRTGALVLANAIPGTNATIEWYNKMQTATPEIKTEILAMLRQRDKKYWIPAVREALRTEGFVPLFNGKDLTGWKGLVGNPLTRAKMSTEELAKEQAKADELMRTHWRVEDGILVFDGKGSHLCTERDYSDFEMQLDWKVEPGGDSGIYLRGSPQVQIWDTAQWPEGSGGLYNNQKHASKPLKAADKPVGEWNRLYIKMTGDRVTVYLNDTLVVNNVVMENYWDRSQPVFPTGQIELQSHGTRLYFRNILIKEPGKAAVIVQKSSETAPPLEEGFVELFNGQDLSGWIGDKEGYVAEDGKIVVHPERGGGSGNLYTEKEYSDFILRFEFKLTPDANNGLGIRAPLEGDAAYVGMELQILDNTADMYKNLKEWQYHGSIYGVVPAKRGYLHSVGSWNAEEVIVKGRHVTVNLNDVIIVDANLDEATANGTIDGRDHPGLKREKGHIGFLGHGSRVEFRNIRIKELK